MIDYGLTLLDSKALTKDDPTLSMASCQVGDIVIMAGDIQAKNWHIGDTTLDFVCRESGSNQETALQISGGRIAGWIIQNAVPHVAVFGEWAAWMEDPTNWDRVHGGAYAVHLRPDRELVWGQESWNSATGTETGALINLNLVNNYVFIVQVPFIDESITRAAANLYNSDTVLVPGYSVVYDSHPGGPAPSEAKITVYSISDPGGGRLFGRFSVDERTFALVIGAIAPTGYPTPPAEEADKQRAYMVMV